jgi:hypothetical protein
MTIEEAKEAVAFKYFREKWNTLADHEMVRHFDEVAELYAQFKAENLPISGVRLSLPTDKEIEIAACDCNEDNVLINADYHFIAGAKYMRSKINDILKGNEA